MVALGPPPPPRPAPPLSPSFPAMNCLSNFVNLHSGMMSGEAGGPAFNIYVNCAMLAALGRVPPLPTLPLPSAPPPQSSTSRLFPAPLMPHLSWPAPSSLHLSCPGLFRLFPSFLARAPCWFFLLLSLTDFSSPGVKHISA